MCGSKPFGKTPIEVCTNLSCALAGADALIESTCRKLGVAEGEMTPDGKFTVNRVECLAACGGGPAVQINGEWLENCTDGDLDRGIAGHEGTRDVEWPEMCTEADLDRVIAGQEVLRYFDWPKSAGESIILRNCWKDGSETLE